MTVNKPCVLVFSGSDPSGGAGISADIEAIAAQGAHALPVITALTVQDNDHVFSIHPIASDLILQQADALLKKMPVHVVKIGILASQDNATALADWLSRLKAQQPHLQIVLDPVLASGRGDALAIDNAVQMMKPLLNLATVVTPNLPEAALLCPGASSALQQARCLMNLGATSVLIKGGHSADTVITNQWFDGDKTFSWQWPRLDAEFHGSGCTLASAIAGQLACGKSRYDAINLAQVFCQKSLEHAYAIAPGQRIPQRS